MAYAAALGLSRNPPNPLMRPNTGFSHSKAAMLYRLLSTPSTIMVPRRRCSLIRAHNTQPQTSRQNSSKRLRRDSCSPASPFQNNERPAQTSSTRNSRASILSRNNCLRLAGRLMTSHKAGR